MKVTNKFVFLTLGILILIINFALLFSYYNFYLSDKMTNDLIAAKNNNHENIYIIKKSIEGKNIDEAINLIKLYVKNNGGYVTLNDIDGNVLYSNKQNNVKLFSATSLIIIDGQEYEITFSKLAIIPGIKAIRNFMFFEIIIVSIIVIILFLISSKAVINPIDIITSDINDYRFGRRPYKRKMPKNMQKIQNAFVDMVDNLELKKEDQNRIIASISHDLKTPLTSVIGYADRLKNKNLSIDKKDEYISKIYNKALNMKSILDEFDDYQSCNIKDTLKKEKITVKEIFKMVKTDYEAELLDKDIKLVISSTCDSKCIMVDIVKIKRIFSNVITNSITHFDGKKGLIKIKAYIKENMITFEVADNGGGIDDVTNLKRIFEPLFTTDPSRKISGLGLSICKQIIDAHDGIIYAKNNNMKGLSIIFMLPMCFNKF